MKTWRESQEKEAHVPASEPEASLSVYKDLATMSRSFFVSASLMPINQHHPDVASSQGFLP